jgi:hypothetical protein
MELLDHQDVCSEKKTSESIHRMCIIQVGLESFYIKVFIRGTPSPPTRMICCYSPKIPYLCIHGIGLSTYIFFQNTVEASS